MFQTNASCGGLHSICSSFCLVPHQKTRYSSIYIYILFPVDWLVSSLCSPAQPAATALQWCAVQYLVLLGMSLACVLQPTYMPFVVISAKRKSLLYSTLAPSV